MKEERKLSRRQREKMRHRREILQAALDLFAERGYHNVSMRDIAERAEFGVGTLYNFFQNKEDLYKALVMDQAERFHVALLKAIEEGRDEYEKILNFIHAKGQVFMAGTKAVRLYFAETRGASFNIKAGLETKIREMYEQFLQKLAAVFASGIDKGIFRKEDPYYLALALDSVTNAFLLRWLEDPQRHDYEKNIPVITSIFFEPVKLRKEG